MVTLSSRARDPQLAGAEQAATRDHIERIHEQNRADEVVQQKLHANAKVEAKAIEAIHKEDEAFAKRINVHDQG